MVFLSETTLQVDISARNWNLVRDLIDKAVNDAFNLLDADE